MNEPHGSSVNLMAMTRFVGDALKLAATIPVAVRSHMLWSYGSQTRS